MKVNRNNVLRHNFAIWVMGRKPGWFKPQRYLYRCLRCKWAFMVNDEQSGSVRVVDDKELELSGAERLQRVASFSDGPCPGYPSAIVETPARGEKVIPLRRENRAKAARDARAM